MNIVQFYFDAYHIFGFQTIEGYNGSAYYDIFCAAQFFPNWQVIIIPISFEKTQLLSYWIFTPATLMQILLTYKIQNMPGNRKKNIVNNERL